MILEQSVAQTIPLILRVSEIQRPVGRNRGIFTPFLHLRPPLRATPSEVRKS